MNQLAPPRLGPGIYADVPERVYHSDPAIEISASASILRTLYTLSPEHAAAEHPRINPDFQPGESTDAQANGSILHALIMGQPPCWRVLNFDDYRKDAAKAAKRAAQDDGLIPILAHKFEALQPVAESLRVRLEREQPETWSALTNPETLYEATVISRVENVLCRSRVDVLPPASVGFVADFKFTGRDAEPEGWAKRMREDYLFQASFYPKVIEAVRGDLPEFRFIVCETDAPYGVSVHAAHPVLVGKGWRRVQVALGRWAWCLKNNRWPGYMPLVYCAEPPGWWEKQDDEAAARDAFVDRLMMSPPEPPPELEPMLEGADGDRLAWGA